MQPERLAKFLRYWNSNDGSYYSPVSIICFRASMKRYFNSASVNWIIDIINDPVFKMANNMLATMIGKYQDLRMAKSKAESQYQEIN